MRRYKLGPVYLLEKKWISVVPRENPNLRFVLFKVLLAISLQGVETFGKWGILLLFQSNS